MYPILYEWKGIVLPAWHVLFVTGAIAAFWVFQYLISRHKIGVPPKYIHELFIVVYVCGYFGARGLSVLVDEPFTTGVWENLTALFRLGSMTFFGGAIAGGVCGVLYAWYRKLPIMRLFDLGIPAVFVGLGLGRIGCFLNGDDYGKAAQFVEGQQPFWAIVLPSLDQVPRIPVQLIESLFAFCAALFLIYLLESRKNQVGASVGMVGWLGVFLYSVFRFFIEFWRDDPRGTVFDGMFSTSQMISIILVIYFLFYCGFIWFRQKLR